MEEKRIIIIGGGFAGLNLLKSLADDSRFSVTLVDKNNYNFFPPLLYQLATGQLEVSNIAYPFRKLIRKFERCRLRTGELIRIVPEEKKVLLSSGKLTYDYLVLATGAIPNFFGMENVQRHALPMKSVDDALYLRNHILVQLEKGAVTDDPEERSRSLNIVIAGGGPTGVELAGMLADLRSEIVHKDYPELKAPARRGMIYLVDGLDALLKPMSERSQKYTAAALEKMGVQVSLGKQVKDYDGATVQFSDGSAIPASTLIWAAGVTCPVFEGIPVECYGRGKRLLTDAYNRVNGLDDIYAIGDGSVQLDSPGYPNGHPQLAQVAIQQGTTLGVNFRSMISGAPLRSFRYNDKGTMAIIGRNKAVVDLGKKIHFQGFFAWMMWLFVHLISLVTLRNKITTLYNWMTAYFSKDQSLRMIIRPEKDQ